MAKRLTVSLFVFCFLDLDVRPEQNYIIIDVRGLRVSKVDAMIRFQNRCARVERLASQCVHTPPDVVVIWKLKLHCSDAWPREATQRNAMQRNIPKT